MGAIEKRVRGHLARQNYYSGVVQLSDADTLRVVNDLLYLIKEVRMRAEEASVRELVMGVDVLRKVLVDLGRGEVSHDDVERILTEAEAALRKMGGASSSRDIVDDAEILEETSGGSGKIGRGGVFLEA